MNPTDKWKRWGATRFCVALFVGKGMKQEKLKLYTIDMKYIRDLHRVDDRVQSVSPQIHKSNRPFVGVVVICDTHQYCIPLDHPKPKHNDMKNDIDFMRIIDEDKLIGVLNFNNMIPVDGSVVQLLRITHTYKDSPAERAYKILCAKELDWIQKNQETIIKRANKVYQMITSDIASYGLKKRCNDFKRLEAVLSKRSNKSSC